MDIIAILAQQAQPTDTASAASVQVEISRELINWLWANVTHLRLLEALTFISFGIVCLFYGWRVFKVLVVIAFGIVGMMAGAVLAERVSGQQSQVVGGIIGLVILASVSIPLMKWAVGFLGALAGAIMTSGVWYAAQLPEEYIWAGALIGFIAGGMMSFIIFRVAVMLFSCFGGSVLLFIGVISLLHLYSPTSAQIEALFFNNKWFLPLALIIPTAIGLVAQNKFIRGSKDWEI